MFDKTTYNLLKELYNCEKMDTNEIDSFTGCTTTNGFNVHASFLLENHLISREEVYDSPDEEDGYTGTGKTYFKINLHGRAYIEQRRKDFFQFWFPYAITTIVAIAGLLVAIAGLPKDRGQQQAQNQCTQDSSHIQVQISNPQPADIQCVYSLHMPNFHSAAIQLFDEKC